MMQRAISKLNERELELAQAGTGASWHDDYKDSPHVFVGGLAPELTEGDVVAVFSQYGRVAAVDLARDRTTGRSRGFAFVAYADQRSTVLAVDNFNGATVLGRTLRVDHVKKYRGSKAARTAPDAAAASAELGVVPPSSSSSSKEAEAAREKLRRAERRLQKCVERERAGKMTHDDAERERAHLQRMVAKYQRRIDRSSSTL